MVATDGLITDLSRQLHRDGFCVLADVFSNAETENWNQRLADAFSSDDAGMLRSRGSLYGSRSLLRVAPFVAEIANHPFVHRFCSQILGSEWGVVRGLYFDKPPERSWTLPWHRDRTIAVKEHLDADDLQRIQHRLDGDPGFTNPTMKAGIPHLIAPEGLLRRMITLRLHLDPMTLENGPLVVQPGSHDSTASDDELSEATPSQLHTVQTSAGSIFVMRPLLAHTSLLSDPDTTLHRRVVHLELAPKIELPRPLLWHDFIECHTATIEKLAASFSSGGESGAKDIMRGD